MVNLFRIALANIRYPATPQESVSLAEQAIAHAAMKEAQLLCFPECYVPGYRIGKSVPPPDAKFLENAWSVIAKATAKANITVVLGTERFLKNELRLTALVINPDGSIAGFQDKVQLDPSEDSTYTPGSERHIFEAGPLSFGIAICHEGWRYPETVRWAADLPQKIGQSERVGFVIQSPSQFRKDSSNGKEGIYQGIQAWSSKDGSGPEGEAVKGSSRSWRLRYLDDQVGS